MGTMAAVSAERCTDWVKDSRICVQKNELIKDNHYSIKDVEKTETTDQTERKTAKGSNYPGGQSSGDDSTAASCGSTPPTVEGSDDSKNSSDTDSPDNDASGNMKQDKRETEEKQHKRVHYQDHKLSAKNIKQHQKINRRLQRSPMKLVQNKSTENFQLIYFELISLEIFEAYDLSFDVVLYFSRSIYDPGNVLFCVVFLPFRVCLASYCQMRHYPESLCHYYSLNRHYPQLLEEYFRKMLLWSHPLSFDHQGNYSP